MEKQPDDENSNTSAKQLSIEEHFLALPPLSSEDFLHYVEDAPTEALPPEVLVRAFRQLPPDSASSRATLCRLFRRSPERIWEYLGPTVAYARRHLRSIPGGDYEDALQDALQRILQTLAGPRGALAERAFHAFCRWELIDAGRQKYGRKLKRVLAEESLETPQETPEKDPLVGLFKAQGWRADLRPNQIALIEKIAERVLSGIPNSFIRDVAREAWFESQRATTSGGTRSSDGSRSLMSRFPDKSRYQILRALRNADAQLAAALLADPDLELSADLHSLLKEIKARTSTSARPAKRNSHE
jgi:hypothetical protein